MGKAKADAQPRVKNAPMCENDAQARVKNAQPRVDKVIDTSRARVVCSGHTQTGININTCFSDHARTHARRRPFTKAEAVRSCSEDVRTGVVNPTVKKQMLNRLRKYPHLQKALRRFIGNATGKKRKPVEKTHQGLDCFRCWELWSFGDREVLGNCLRASESPHLPEAEATLKTQHQLTRLR